MSSTTIKETLHGNLWNLISPSLTTDDVVQCRTAARRWNVGGRYGEQETFFEFLEDYTFVRQWYRDVEGNKVWTKSKKNIPFVESSRQWVLHAPDAAAVPCEVTSIGEAATNLMNDARIREISLPKATMIVTGKVSRRLSVYPCLYTCSASHLHVYLLVVNTCIARLL